MYRPLGFVEGIRERLPSHCRKRLPHRRDDSFSSGICWGPDVFAIGQRITIYGLFDDRNAALKACYELREQVAGLCQPVSRGSGNDNKETQAA